MVSAQSDSAAGAGQRAGFPQVSPQEEEKEGGTPSFCTATEVSHRVGKVQPTKKKKWKKTPPKPFHPSAALRSRFARRGSPGLKKCCPPHVHPLSFTDMALFPGQKDINSISLGSLARLPARARRLLQGLGAEGQSRSPEERSAAFPCTNRLVSSL